MPSTNSTAGDHHEAHEGHEEVMEFDDLSRKVIGCELEVHKVLGPGLLESAYERCLSHELNLANISFRVQSQFPYGTRELNWVAVIEPI